MYCYETNSGSGNFSYSSFVPLTTARFSNCDRVADLPEYWQDCSGEHFGKRDKTNFRLSIFND
ncbi:MAG TPA: hypothetical protein V6C71_04585 [Coleofasciculaceae cyanobacterium]